MPSLLYRSASATSRSPAAETRRTLAPSAISAGARVGRRHRQAALARGGDPAGLAVLLHAEVDRLAPVLVLVVVVAARVQAQVAAQRAHVAQMRRGHLRRRLPQPAVVFAHRARADDFGQREPGAQREAGSVRDLLQSLDPAQRDQRRRRLLAPLHVGQQVGAAGDQHAARSFAREDARGFRHAGRRADTGTTAGAS